MPAICLYFQVHQPFRLKEFNFFRIGVDHNYEDEERNREILNRIADKCYLPANDMLLKLIKKHKGNFKVAFSISGTALEQMETYRPEVIASFQKLAATGCVEFLAETYYHSLSYIYSPKEFERQVKLHSEKIKELFNISPTVFRNTELIYNNDIAATAERMGYNGVLAEGADNVLGSKSCDHVYLAKGSENIKVLLRNYKLSDDISFRFSDKNWKEYPLTPKKYASWVHVAGRKGDTVNLFMDYETLGEHQWKESGIFDFFEGAVNEILQDEYFSFMTPSEITSTMPAKQTFDCADYTSWADTQRDLSAWLDNKMQKEAAQRLFNLQEKVMKTEDSALVEKWRKLQSSDHIYYMSTKFWNDGEVHQYFSPYGSPFDAYINFMNVLSDMESLFSKKNEIVLP